MTRMSNSDVLVIDLSQHFFSVRDISNDSISYIMNVHMTANEARHQYGHQEQCQCQLISCMIYAEAAAHYSRKINLIKHTGRRF